MFIVRVSRSLYVEGSCPTTRFIGTMATKATSKGTDRVIFRKGDLLDSDTQYIVHQANCKSAGNPKGLAKILFEKFSYANTYSKDIARVPGTISIHEPPSPQAGPRVINLYGQDFPGKPSAKENRKDRLSYFKAGLQRIKSISDLKSIAFPYFIGCGLAGGKWPKYLELIGQLAEERNDVQVVIYRLDEHQGASAPLTREHSSSSSSGIKTLLVLLDMNGTLLVREAHQLSRPPDLVQKGKKYYFRPGAKKFVSDLIKLPCARVAFNTSMTFENAKVAVQWMLGPTWEQHVALYHRDYQKKDDFAENPWDTMRDLDAILNKERQDGNHFSIDNLIMVDDTPRKMREYKNNALFVPSFDADTFKSEGSDNWVLQSTFDYIQLLTKKMQRRPVDSVSSYVSQNVFAIRPPDDNDDGTNDLVSATQNLALTKKTDKSPK